MYEFEVEGNITGKQRPRVNRYTGNIYTPNATKDYEEYIRQCFFLKYPKNVMLEGRVEVEIEAYLKIPANTKKVDKENMINNFISPVKKPDIDNIAKVVLDSINSYVIKDDSQVTKISVEKKYAETPKLVIRIKEY